MCGIAGIISINPNHISKERLQKMTDAIAHRGPDGEGFWINPGAKLGLGHRRLSIIDPSDQAAQPMHLANRYSVIHNGEIYNYVELKQALQQKGYSFQTSSDTEVLLAAYDCYGDQCLKYFDGMFAFVLWDEKEQTLFCARDRFGEKPFYYAFEDDQFLFASEAKALWAAGIKKEINYPLLLNYLTVGHTDTPVDKTISFFQHIFSLPPAHYLKFELASFSFELNPYWDCDKETQLNISENDAKEKFSSLFFDSVKKRLRSDMPIGTSLSGGLDSSSIAAAIHELGATHDSHQTFSAIFPGFEKDESSFIQIATKEFGLNGFTVSPTADGLIHEFEKLCYHQEIPFSSSSVYAQYKVFELASSHQVKVLLDGQGADEILGGYPKYIHWYLQELFRAKPLAAMREKKAFQKNHIPFEWGLKNHLATWFPAQAAHQLEKREAKKIRQQSAIALDFKEQYFDRPTLYKPLVTKLNDILYFNTFHQGLEELLRYADRNAMAHGRELRLPFLSHELVEFVFSLPSHFKIHQGWTKWILRTAMGKKLPPEIAWRKDKTGYEPPQKMWMENKTVQDYMQEAKQKLVNEKILNPTVLNKKNQPRDAYAADNFDWRYMVAAQCIS
ncbi:MAG: asparagine synthase (glutamine-hydrolyzing) [Bacteroidetes bacterium]|nr:asparagine synthase (glutamine-hydrolyzing) [Bacteroidota bacterium]